MALPDALWQDNQSTVWTIMVYSTHPPFALKYKPYYMVKPLLIRFAHVTMAPTGGNRSDNGHSENECKGQNHETEDPL